AVRDDIPLFAAHRTGRPHEQFGIFTSTQALQQRLQRDTLLTKPSASATAGPSTNGVAVGTLQGPAIVNRPWKKLLAGKNPAVSPLSRCVPEDFYLAEFRSL